MPSRGLTLIELVIALAALVVLTSLAVPGFGAAAERARLRSAAEALAADLNAARYEAARRGMPLHMDYQPGPGWCWAVTSAPDCGCGAVQPCQLKTTRESEYPGIALLQGQTTSFDPAGTLLASGQGALLQSRRGEQLRVDVSLLGRASICVAAGTVPGYPAC